MKNSTYGFKKSNLKKMDNVGIVVDSHYEVISFFIELGLRLEGRAMLEGEWSGRPAPNYRPDLRIYSAKGDRREVSYYFHRYSFLYTAAYLG